MRSQPPNDFAPGKRNWLRDCGAVAVNGQGAFGGWRMGSRRRTCAPYGVDPDVAVSTSKRFAWLRCVAVVGTATAITKRHNLRSSAAPLGPERQFRRRCACDLFKASRPSCFEPNRSLGREIPESNASYIASATEAPGGGGPITVSVTPPPLFSLPF